MKPKHHPFFKAPGYFFHHPWHTDKLCPPQTTPNGTTVQVAVSGTGVSDASAAKTLYTIAAGTYTFQISGFGAGDVLDFPASNNASVNNASFTDGSVDLTWGSDGSVVTIHLTGLSAANDAQLNSVANFNSVFGAGTIA